MIPWGQVKVSCTHWWYVGHPKDTPGIERDSGDTQVSSLLIWILGTFNRLWDLELLALREPRLRPAHGRWCCQLWPLSFGVWWPGHNKLICLCRYRSPGFHVQSWYDEVKDYTYPYPHECNPWCPERCSGAMCTHYTQVKLEEQAMTSA